MVDTSADFGFPYSTGEAQDYVLYSEFVNMVQLLTNGVVDRAINAPPGSPTEGDAYILGASPTGVWAGRANALAGWLGGTWVFFPGDDDAGAIIAMGARQEGVAVWVRDENVLYRWSGSAWTADLGTVADFGASFETTPAAGSIIGRLSVASALTIAVDMAGSFGNIGTNPGATWDIDLQDDGVSVGTISISTGGAFTFTSAGSPPAAISIAAGSEITFVAPAGSPAEATAANGSIVIRARVA